jgi:hypothetical protein
MDTIFSGGNFEVIPTAKGAATDDGANFEWEFAENVRWKAQLSQR